MNVLCLAGAPNWRSNPCGNGKYFPRSLLIEALIFSAAAPVCVTPSQVLDRQDFRETEPPKKCQEERLMREQGRGCWSVRSTSWSVCSVGILFLSRICSRVGVCEHPGAGHHSTANFSARAPPRRMLELYEVPVSCGARTPWRQYFPLTC